MTRLHCILALLISMLWGCSDKSLVSFETDALRFAIDAKGQLISLYDKTGKAEYKATNVSAPILSLRIDGVVEEPLKAQWDEEAQLLTLDYPSESKATIKIVEKEGYFTCEIEQIESPKEVELAIWGPYPTTISQTVGECVGVVRDSIFAFGIRALNAKTIGGYPTTEDDVDPFFDIFATNSLVDVDDSIKVLYRGQTAKHTEFGSVVQAYVRNRNKDRIIPMWNHDRFTAPAYDDGGVIGSKIALFGSPEPQALDYIEKIVLGENLPHPLIKGEWGKRTPYATAAYIIYPFNEKNIEEAIAFTKRTGLEYLYHGEPFSTWGHFTLDPKEFPNGVEGLKNCVEKAAKEGIQLGIHTLSNFTTTNDPYVTPIPDKRLARVGATTVIGAIGATDKEIEIASPDFFNQMKNNSLHGVMIGEELIRYEKVSDSAPWKLLNCQRGAWGTKASAHKEGTEIAKLLDHPYNVFLTDIDLTKEQARNIADLFNKTGIMQISFDGLEGAWSTGLGQYGLSMMTEEWYNHLEEPYKNCINDASMTTHYNWTMFTRMNWGEPWYAGFRESQMTLRILNQDFYRRNLMPSMLGWFKYTSTTSIEDVEWLLARSAAFDAGYTLVTNGEHVAKNGETERIIKAIREWENARMAEAFPTPLKMEMEHLNNEYSLTETSSTSWELTPYSVQRFKHQNVQRQPGEPIVSKWTFNNPYERQSIGFLIKANDDISKITLSIGGYATIEVSSSLKKGQWLKYEGGDTLRVYDENWQLIASQTIEKDRLTVDAGETTIVFGCTFGSSDVEKAVSAEIKTKGQMIPLQASR